MMPRPRQNGAEMRDCSVLDEEDLLGPGENGTAPEGQEASPSEADGISRRSFVQGAGVLAGAVSVGIAAPALGEAKRQAMATAPLKLMPLSLTINGEKKQMQVDPRISLLDLLREEMDLTGTKKGCDHGQCGACTVIANGRRVNACLSLALTLQGGEVTTIEGLAKGDELHPMQTAFLEHDGYQCGYCTPGQIVSAVALLDEAKKGQPSQVSDLKHSGPVELNIEEIRERMSGNICRCGAYPGIVAAVQQVFRQG